MSERRTTPVANPSTHRQQIFLRAIAREHGMSTDELNAECERTYGASTIEELSRRDAAAFIDHLIALGRDDED
jgi:hypothetical protein